MAKLVTAMHGGVSTSYGDGVATVTAAVGKMLENAGGSSTLKDLLTELHSVLKS